ncbi:MAG: hypothetical protein J6Y62_04605 [Clostridia bacterium]|nr:hypothetical protein [Clostridia bacterium]
MKNAFWILLLCMSMSAEEFKIDFIKGKDEMKTRVHDKLMIARDKLDKPIPCRIRDLRADEKRYARDVLKENPYGAKVFMVEGLEWTGKVYMFVREHVNGKDDKDWCERGVACFVEIGDGVTPGDYEKGLYSYRTAGWDDKNGRDAVWNAFMTDYK